MSSRSCSKKPLARKIRSARPTEVSIASTSGQTARWRRRAVLTEPSRLTELNQNLVLYFTGFTRTASEIAQEQIRTTPQRMNELDAMLQLVDEAEAIVTSPRRSLAEFGCLLHEAWQIS